MFSTGRIKSFRIRAQQTSLRHSLRTPQQAKALPILPSLKAPQRPSGPPRYRPRLFPWSLLAAPKSEPSTSSSCAPHSTRPPTTLRLPPLPSRTRHPPRNNLSPRLSRTPSTQRHRPVPPLPRDAASAPLQRHLLHPSPHSIASLHPPSRRLLPTTSLSRPIPTSNLLVPTPSPALS